MEYHLPLHLGVVAIEKGAFRSPSTKVVNFTYIYISKVGDRSVHQGVGESDTPFPGLLHFTLDTYLILLRVKQGGIKYHF